MYNQQMYARMVRFQRTAMDNTFAIFTSLQGYGDKILKKSLEQNPWLPENSKNTCIGLSDTCLYGSNNLKKLIDQGFDEMERLVSRAPLSRESGKTVKSITAPRTAEPAARRQTAGRKAAAPQKPAATSTGAGTSASVATPVKQPAAPPPEKTPEPKPPATPMAAPATFRPASPPSAAAVTGMQPAGATEKTIKDDTKTTGKIS